MELRDVKALVLLMREHGLLELEIEDKKGKVRLVRGSAAGADDRPALAAAGRVIARTDSAPPSPGASAKRQVAAAPKGSAGAAGDIDLKPNQKLILSPMVGTFYRAASPNASPFVEEGDTVRKGQALCIIEAMKMMNEIEADTGGCVAKILCDNGQPVEYNQPLIIIEPA